MDTQNLHPEVLKIKDFIINIRRQIHQYPELAYEEHQTSDLIKSHLIEFGYQVIPNVGKTGLVGILKGEKQGPCYLLRADMDALLVQENSGDPYSSKIPGKHHACGHDGHVAMLLGLAKIIKDWHKKIHGTVKLCFQPAEEGGAGAKKMIEDPKYPVLENPSVDMCFGIHLLNNYYPGTIISCSGPITGNSDRFQINIQGLGGHGSLPNQCKDALVIGCQLVCNFQTIISRNVFPGEQATICVGKITSGSGGGNIIASDCEIIGGFRSNNKKARSLLIKRMQDICNGLAIAYECQIKFEYQLLYDVVVNDQKAFNIIEKTAKKVVGEKNFIYNNFGLAGEDFTFFSQKVPSGFLMVGSAPENSIQEEKVLRPHHSPFFTIDEKSILIGTSFWVQFIEDQMVNI
ncbi:hypothetical protein IMG5_105670 [Ichthyophthirius multifiliis]|uniref:Peptidase M20 dimerisation domain-containing protein n=1 Tax=Ichthyophthirius multifiliis TaxID=5932 RepID=G0QT28_ICHMU|nr:hypothetical protein IMG5_105670 [Ichthyophthirius multifiliis]EGR31627.1 hypothetical protein IMG5_105670 [Ichthyophthirius multifiliis]|eukprot:XP_004035113.1 hypothetical protein IMG5_105670 [Ichthyophthirius multifiliis]